MGRRGAFLAALLCLAGGWTARSSAAQDSAPVAAAQADADPDDAVHLPALFADDLARPDTFGIGRVAKDVAKQLPALEALGAALGPHIRDLGYERIRPVIARDNAEMIRFLRTGIVEVVSETPLSAMHFVEEGSATMLLREQRHGRAAFHSVVFVRDDSAVAALADIATSGSRRIAFEDSGSTTAFLLPLAAMKKAGLDPVPLEDSRRDPPAGRAGYFFAKSESAIVAAVLRGIAEAGAISDEDWQRLASRDPDGFASLRIVAQTKDVPRGFLLTGPALAPERREQLRRLLLELAEKPAGRAALDRYADIDALLPVDGRSPDPGHGLEDLEEVWAMIRGEVR